MASRQTRGQRARVRTPAQSPTARRHAGRAEAGGLGGNGSRRGRLERADEEAVHSLANALDSLFQEPLGDATATPIEGWTATVPEVDPTERVLHHRSYDPSQRAEDASAVARNLEERWQGRFRELSGRVLDLEVEVQSRRAQVAADASSLSPDKNSARADVNAMYSQLVELAAELTKEKKQWRRGLQDSELQVSKCRQELSLMVDSVRAEVRQGAKRPPATAPGLADTAAFGSSEVSEMRSLLRETNVEFDAVKAALKDLHATQKACTRVEQQLDMCQTRLDSQEREHGADIGDLRRQLAQLDAEIAAERSVNSVRMLQDTKGAVSLEESRSTDDVKRLERIVEELAATVRELQSEADEDFWEEHRAPSGQTYFYNAKTKESTWNKPDVLSQLPRPPARHGKSGSESELSDLDEPRPFAAPEPGISRELLDRLGRVEDRLDEWEVDAANGKTAASTQLRGLQAELAVLTGQVGDKIPHLAFAADLDDARQQYDRFNRFSEHLVNEFAEVKERMASTERFSREAVKACTSDIQDTKSAVELLVKQAVRECTEVTGQLKQTVDEQVEDLNQSVTKNWTSLEASIRQVTTRIDESEAHLKETVEQVSLELYDKIVTAEKETTRSLQAFDGKLEEKLSTVGAEYSHRLETELQQLRDQSAEDVQIVNSELSAKFEDINVQFGEWYKDTSAKLELEATQLADSIRSLDARLSDENSQLRTYVDTTQAEAAAGSALQRMVDSMATSYLEENLRSEFDALEHEIKQNMGALGQYMDTRTADMKAHVGVEVKALQRMISDTQTEVQGIIEKEITMVNQDIQRESDEINQRLSSSITACTSQMDAEIEAVSSALSAATGELVAGLESCNNRLEAEALATRENAAQNELIAATLRLSDQAAIENGHKQLQAEILRLGRILDTSAAELHLRIDQSNSFATHLHHELAAGVVMHEADQEALQDQMVESIQALNNAVSHRLAEMSETADRSAATLKESQAAMQEAFSNDLQTSILDVRRDLDANVLKLQTESADASARYASQREEDKQALAAIEEALSSDLQRLGHKLDDEITLLTDDMTRDSARLAETIERSVIDLQFDMEGHVDSLQGEVDIVSSKIEKTRDSMTAHIADEISSTTALVVTCTAELRAAVKHSQDEQKEFTTAQARALDARIDDKVRSVSKTVKDTSAELRDSVSGLTRETDERLSALVADTTQASLDVAHRLEETKQELETKLQVSTRATRLVQKLMGRADGADIFAEFDVSRDGLIGRDEVRQGFNKLGEALSDADVESIMSIVDPDGGGKMCYAEYVQTGRLSQDLAALTQAYERNIAELATRLDEEANVVHNRVDNTLLSLQEMQVNSLAAETTLNAAIILQDKKLDASLCDVHEQIAEEVAKLNASAEEASKHNDEVAAQLRQTVEDRTAALKADVDEKDNMMHSRIETEASQLNSNLESHVRALRLLHKLMGHASGDQAFKEFDTNGDGLLTREEIRKGFAKLGEDMNDADLERFMALADSNHDGKIDYTEFVQTGKLTDTLAALDTRMETEMRRMGADTQARLESLQSQFTSDVSELTAETQQHLSALQERTHAEFDAMREDQEVSIAAVTASLESQGKSTADGMATLRSDIKETMLEAEVLNTTLRVIDQTAVKHLAAEVQARMSSSAHGVSQAMSELESLLLSKIAEVIKYTTDFEAEVVANKVATTSSLQRLDEKVNAVDARIGSRIDQEITDVRTDSNRDLSMLQDEVQSAVNTLHTNMESEIVALREEESASRAALIQNLESLGKTHMAEMLSMRTDITSTMQEAEVYHTTLRTIDQAAVKHLAAHVQSRLEAAELQHEQDTVHLRTTLDGHVRALRLLHKLMGHASGDQAFKEFDTNGDGLLTREEIRKGFAKLGEDMNDADLERFMALADSNHDGKIDYTEFVQTGKLTDTLAALDTRMETEMRRMGADTQARLESLQSQFTSDVSELTAETQQHLSALQERTHAEFDAMREDQEVSIAAVTASLESQGKSTADGMATLRSDIKETMLATESTSAALRVMDQTVVKQLASQVQNRFEVVDARVQSTAENVTSLQNTLTESIVELEHKTDAQNTELHQDVDAFRAHVNDSIAALQQKTEAELNAVREEEAASMATVMKSLEDQGESTAADLATLRSDINETMREADVASSTLRAMDQTVVKQLANQVQSRLEEVNSRLDSGSEATDSLEQKLIAALSDLQQKTEAELNAVREEEAASMATVMKSLEDQGESTAADLATLRSDINETMREADVASSTLRAMDQTVVKQLANQVQSRLEEVNSRLDSGSEATDSLEQKLIAALSDLQQKTEAELNAVREEEAASMATVMKSLEDQGESTAADLATLRSDINETMREADVASSTLRAMDQTVVKQLANQVQSRLEEVNSRLDSGNEATDSLEQKLIAALSDLQQKTEAELNAVREEEAASMATVMKSLEDQGESTAADLATLRSDINETMREADVASSTLRAMDQTVVKQLANQVQSRLEEVNSRLDSGNEATDSLEQKLIAALSDLQQKTEAELNAVREEEAASMATVMKSLEDQGESTAADLATLRSDINETMREADVASSTLRAMDQTVVKQLANQVQSRLEEVNSRLDSGSEATDSLEQKLIAALSDLQQKTEAELNAVREEEAASMATVMKSLEDQGESTAADLATLRSDINETMREADVASSTLRAMDQTVVKQLANQVQSRLEEVNSRLDSGSEATDSLEQKLIAALSDLQQKTEAELNAVREEEAVSMATVMKSLEDQGESTAADLATLRSDINETMREADVASSTLRAMDQTVVKQLANQVQSRLEEVNSRLDSGNEATDSLEQKLIAALSDLQQKTEAELNAVREEEAASMATVMKSLEDQGESTAADLATLRSDINETMREADVASSTLRAMDQTVVKQLADRVEQRFGSLSESLSVLERKMLVDISNSIVDMRREFDLKVDHVATTVVDSESRLTDAITEQCADLYKRHQLDMQVSVKKFTASTEIVEQRVGEVEDHVTTIMDEHIGSMDSRIHELDTRMLTTIESKLEPLSDAFAAEQQASLSRLRQLHTRMIASEVSNATLRLACETAVGDLNIKVSDFGDGLLEVEDRIGPLESDDRGTASASGWSVEVLSDQLAASEGQVARFGAELAVLDRRVSELEQLTTDGETAAAWGHAATVSQ